MEDRKASLFLLILSLLSYFLGIVLYKVTEPVTVFAGLSILIGLIGLIGGIFLLCLAYTVPASG